MTTTDAIDAVVTILDAHFDGTLAPSVADRIAWRTARGALRRARRISTTTLPALADAAQRAIIVRDFVRESIPALPHTLVGRASQALDHAVALVTVLGTGGRSSSEPPPE